MNTGGSISVSSSRGERDGGSGLGLYIVRGAMEAIGGNVAIQSEPGVGTTIILTFRMAADAQGEGKGRKEGP